MEKQSYLTVCAGGSAQNDNVVVLPLGKCPAISSPVSCLDFCY
jgi:hypothetical protein